MAWTQQNKNTSDWTKKSKNTSNWNKQSKNTTSWTEQSKNTTNWANQSKQMGTSTFLLQENKDFLLLEDGSQIILTKTEHTDWANLTKN